VLQNKLFRKCPKTNFWEAGTRRYVSKKSEESAAVCQVISADGKSWLSFALLRSRNDDEFGKLCVSECE